MPLSHIIYNNIITIGIDNHGPGLNSKLLCWTAATITIIPDIYVYEAFHLLYIIYRLLFSFSLTSVKEITEYRCYIILVPSLSSTPFNIFFFNVLIFFI
jgi:hypothetical protein